MKSSKDLTALFEKHFDAKEQEEVLHSAYMSARITELRLSSGLSQLDLSQKSGIPRSVIATIESNDMVPRGDALAKIAEALECKLDLKSSLEGDVVQVNHSNIEKKEILTQLKKLHEEIEVLVNKIHRM